jgi:hypothetical protein
MRGAMPDFPDFARNPGNRIASTSQYTDDIEGYVFDGADGSQVALCTAPSDGCGPRSPRLPGLCSARVVTLLR